MQLSGATLGEVEQIIREVGRFYDDNLCFGANNPPHDLGGVRRPRCRFTLGTVTCDGPGSRRGWQGRRLRSACWHAHRDVMLALFNRHPDALLRTGFATYRGLEDFMDKFEATYYHNAGSLMMPVQFGDLCECGGPAVRAATIDEALQQLQEGSHPRQDDPLIQSIGHMHGLPNEPSGDAYRHIPEPLLPGQNAVQFSTLEPRDPTPGDPRPYRETQARVISYTDIGHCPHFILVPDHYRDDGSCRCDDPSHTEMMEWGYRFDWPQLRWIGEADEQLEEEEEPTVPYPMFCRHQDRCAGLSSCPRYPTCAD